MSVSFLGRRDVVDSITPQALEQCAVTSTPFKVEEFGLKHVPPRFAELLPLLAATLDAINNQEANPAKQNNTEFTTITLSGICKSVGGFNQRLEFKSEDGKTVFEVQLDQLKDLDLELSIGDTKITIDVSYKAGQDGMVSIKFGAAIIINCAIENDNLAKNAFIEVIELAKDDNSHTIWTYDARNSREVKISNYRGGLDEESKKEGHGDLDESIQMTDHTLIRSVVSGNFQRGVFSSGTIVVEHYDSKGKKSRLELICKEGLPAAGEQTLYKSGRISEVNTGVFHDSGSEGHEAWLS